MSSKSGKGGAPTPVPSPENSSTSLPSKPKEVKPKTPGSPATSSSPTSTQSKKDLVKQLAQKATPKKKSNALESTYVIAGFGITGLLLALIFIFKAPERSTSGGSDSRTLLIQGVDYMNGNGVAKDEPKGIELLKRSAALGQPEAMHRLGYLYTYGTDITEADPVTGYEYYLQAAKLGVVESMVNLGLALANGLGVEADMNEAFRWWKKAANRGSPIATGNVGRCYEVGIGGDVNLDKALEFYKKGVLLDDGGSMHHLAMMYLKGINTVKDIEKGIDLLRKSVDKGYSLALSS